MSIVKTIYNLTPLDRSPCLNNETIMTLTYNGHVYVGIAKCHPDDMAFISRKVGRRIALSRARINLMKAELKKEKDKYKIISDFYMEIMTNAPEPLPNEFSVFETRYLKIYSNISNRLKILESAIKKEENSLRTYLKGLDKAIESVTKMRNKDKSN